MELQILHWRKQPNGLVDWRQWLGGDQGVKMVVGLNLGVHRGRDHQPLQLPQLLRLQMLPRQLVVKQPDTVNQVGLRGDQEAFGELLRRV